MGGVAPARQTGAVNTHARSAMAGGKKEENSQPRWKGRRSRQPVDLLLWQSVLNVHTLLACIDDINRASFQVDDGPTKTFYSFGRTPSRRMSRLSPSRISQPLPLKRLPQIPLRPGARIEFSSMASLSVSLNLRSAPLFQLYDSATWSAKSLQFWAKSCQRVCLSRRLMYAHSRTGV